MNQRIKELAEQATTEEADGFKYFDKAKFAELIVRECIEIIDYNDLVGSSTEYYGKKFKEHFGVEE